MHLLRLLATVSLWLSLFYPAQPQKRSLWRRVLRVLGISATPSKQKGPPTRGQAGEIWVAGRDGRTRSKVGAGRDYRSPVFLADNETVIALRGEDVVRLPLVGGAEQKLFAVKGAYKLVGLSAESTDEVLLLLGAEGGQISAAFLSLKDGRLTMIQPDEDSEDDRRMLEHLKGWERVYGDVSVFTETAPRGQGGRKPATDVIVRRDDGEQTNVSRCATTCDQPSLSGDGRHVVYIKSTP